MKVILTESQIEILTKSLLFEQGVDNNTYITKKKHRLNANTEFNIKNPFSWQDIPVGTKFKYDPSTKDWKAWGGTFYFSCGGKFFGNVTKRITYDADNQLAPTLLKFCQKIEKKEYDEFLSKSELSSNYLKVQDFNCIAKVKGPYQNAINWWKNKLDDPTYYQKLKLINKYTDAETKEWIKKYKIYLYNKIKGPFCPKQHTTMYDKHFGTKGRTPNAAAFSTHSDDGDGHLIVVNNYFNLSNSKVLEALFVHEFQHSLYDVKPMTPHESWKKVFPFKVWVDNPVNNSSKSSSKNESAIISKYDVPKNLIDKWKNRLKIEKDPKTTSMGVGYICRETELASRVVRIKNLLNYSTSQKITVNDFKKFLEYSTPPYRNSDSYYLILCWVDNGMVDIQTFLDKLDKNVVAKVEPKNDNDMKDQIT